MSESLSPILSVLGKNWVMRPADQRQILALSQILNEPEIVARLLAVRGVTLDTAAQYLTPTLKAQLPDPFLLKDMETAVTRLQKAIHGHEKICFFGDYDVDGATSTALMLHYFRALGLNPQYYIPDRIAEGYGPNTAAFNKLAQQGIQLIVTLDCGTTSFEPIAAAQALDVDVIVIDHHMGEPRLPNACAIVNPNRLDEPKNPCQNLAAVGVSFLVLVALNQRLRQNGFFQTRSEPDLLSLLDLVALGTVCDVMPLQGLNRAFVTQGLKVLSRRQRPGLVALGDIGGINSTPMAYHLGFVIGPRINAAGRVGCADYGTRLLTTSSEAESRQLAQTLNGFNDERQIIEHEVSQEAYLQAQQQVHSPLIIVHGLNWHPGVIGIVASRIKDRFHRPVLAISFDDEHNGKGSGRSIHGIDLGSLIHAAKQKKLLEGGGGHAMAAGFSLKFELLGAFRGFLEERILATGIDFTPFVSFDGYLSSSALNIEFIESLGRLEPYGQGNPSPRFVIENMRVAHADMVGTQHVRVSLRDDAGIRYKGIAFRAIGTALGDTLLNTKNCALNVLAAVKIDRWNGNAVVNLEIEDIQLLNHVQAAGGLGC